LRQIKNGTINFDKLYSTQEGLSLIKPFARILGPKGLFPNAKVDTLFNAAQTGTPS
jgi:large subunit ribosomal protein L1